MKLKFVAVLLCFLFFTNFCYAKKKQTLPKEKMPETVQEWEEKAKSIPLYERKLEKIEEPKSTKKKYYPEPNYIFEKYNVPSGSKDFDLRFLKKNLEVRPIVVTDNDFQYVAYSVYHYRADIDQIYSEFYIGELEKDKSRKKRILEFNELKNQNPPVITSGVDELYPRLFGGLTLVDWSRDSKKVLVKELKGSTIGGNYRTYLYVYFINDRKLAKISGINRVLRDYFLKENGFNLDEYRYDITPLGFSADNDDMVVFQCFVYQNDFEKTFLGTWGYDLIQDKFVLISKTNSPVSISANGLVLKRVL